MAWATVAPSSTSGVAASAPSARAAAGRAFSSAPNGTSPITDGLLRTNATVSATDSTVVTTDSAARAVCQPNWLINSWPTGLATAAKMDSTAAVMLMARPAPFLNHALMSTGAARYMKNADVTPNTTPYRFHCHSSVA